MESCLLNGKCLGMCFVYKSQASTEGKCAIFSRTADSDFKSIYNIHNMSLQHKSLMNDTKLSKYLWHLCKENIRFDLN